MFTVDRNITEGYMAVVTAIMKWLSIGCHVYFTELSQGPYSTVHLLQVTGNLPSPLTKIAF